MISRKGQDITSEDSEWVKRTLAFSLRPGGCKEESKIYCWNSNSQSTLSTSSLAFYDVVVYKKYTFDLHPCF